MNLNSYHKQAFVSAVMQDVPSPDFGAEFEKLVKKDMLDTAPPALKKALKDKELMPYIVTGNESVNTPDAKIDNTYYSRWDLGLRSVACYKDYKVSELAMPQAQDIVNRAAVSFVKRRELEAQVRNVIAGCRTLKQAHTLLPEFAKYLPEELEVGHNLPAVANLAATLIEAGWPVGKEEAAA